MKSASTQWQETIGADEEARFQRYAEQLVELQRRVGGSGRALHRNQRLGLRATFEVLGDLASPARHGVFATPKRYGCADPAVERQQHAPGRSQA